MVSSRPGFGRWLRVAGTLAVLLALVARAVTGCLVLDAGAAADTQALLAAIVQCDSTATAPLAPDHPLPHPADSGTVTLASLLSQPAPILVPALLPPPPAGALLRRGPAVPVARAPPAVWHGAPSPRSPSLA